MILFYQNKNVINIDLNLADQLDLKFNIVIDVFFVFIGVGQCFKDFFVVDKIIRAF